MPLDWQKITIPFGRGLAQETAPALVTSDKSLEALNAYSDKDGTYEHRPGFFAMSRDAFNNDPAATLTAAHRVVGHDSHTYLSDNVHWFDFSDAWPPAWVKRDKAYEATVTGRYPLARSPADKWYVDAVVQSGVLVAAWQNDDTIVVEFTDIATGARISQQTVGPVDDGLYSTFRLLASRDGNAHVHLIWWDDTSYIYATVWDVGALETAPTTHTVAADHGGAGAAVGDAHCSANYVAVAFRQVTTNHVKIVLWDYEYTSAATVVEEFTPANVITVFVDETMPRVVVAWDSDAKTPTCSIQHTQYTLGLVRHYAVRSLTVMPSIEHIGTLTSTVKQLSACTVTLGGLALGCLAYAHSETGAGVRNGGLCCVCLDLAGDEKYGSKTHHLMLASRPVNRSGKVYAIGTFAWSQSLNSDEGDYPSGVAPIEAMVIEQNFAWLLELQPRLFVAGEGA